MRNAQLTACAGFDPLSQLSCKQFAFREAIMFSVLDNAVRILFSILVTVFVGVGAFVALRLLATGFG